VGGVSRETSLPDTEVSKDHIKQIFDIHPSGQPAQLVDRNPDIFGGQIFIHALKTATERFFTALNAQSMSMARDQRRFARLTPRVGLSPNPVQNRINPRARSG
jgi:hypothetical protein